MVHPTTHTLCRRSIINKVWAAQRKVKPLLVRSLAHNSFDSALYTNCREVVYRFVKLETRGNISRMAEGE